MSKETLSEGAPAPYIVHCDKYKKKHEKNLTAFQKHGPIPPNKPKVSDKFFENLINLKEKEENKRNPLGVSINVTSSGSMTQEIFFDFCRHFVKCLPTDQGKHGSAVILFLDGHASRWNVAALRFLILNRVFPFFLASHTSVWSQPNDNGTIKRLHACVEESTLKIRRWNKAIIPYFNTIFLSSWRLFLQQEANDLFTGSNNATNAFAKTGLFPFNPSSESWEHAIDTLGLDSVLNKRREVKAQWEIRVVKANEGRPVLTVEERTALRNGWEFQDEENEVPSIGASRSDLLIAKMRGDGISSPSSNLNPIEETPSKTTNVTELHQTPFCCSGFHHCILKTSADPKIHSCPVCKKGVHAICGVENPDFKNGKVGTCFSTICMKCHLQSESTTNDREVNKKPTDVTTKSEKGIAFKRPDGKWCVCISDWEPFLVEQSDLMNPEKYFVTPVGSSLTSNDMINSAIQGNPWCYQKYREHIGKIESPFVCTIGDYRVATGGVDRSACFKSLTGELISSAMSASQGHGNTMMPVANKTRKEQDVRTENTLCGKPDH